MAGSVTLALAAARKGAHILRVHDVQQTVDALRIEAVLSWHSPLEELAE